MEGGWARERNRIEEQMKTRRVEEGKEAEGQMVDSSRQFPHKCLWSVVTRALGTGGAGRGDQAGQFERKRKKR